jgi:choline dehydrogenase-like flavoprotein
MASQKYFRNGLVSVGNAPISILAGKLVGGSTAVNTGTCYRPPDRVLEGWCDRLGSDEFSPERMRSYLERVETRLGVQPCSRRVAGPFADLMAAGCDRLGLSHGPILRNASGCDGDGFCIFGCTSEARRSANVAFVPAALEAGALLLTGARASRVLLERGRAVGVVAVSVETQAEITIRARAVVLAGGAISTPLLLLEQGIANRSGQVGRNLTLHPSTCVTAEFEVDVNGHRHVPQGYKSDHFLDEGILLNGALPDYSVLACTLGARGTHLMHAIETRNRLAGLGALVEDQGPGGRVRWLKPGLPLITYNLTRRDVRLLHRGMTHAIDVLRAAGAVRCYPLLHSTLVLDTAEDDRRFRSRAPDPNDFVLTSYHPMGTCRMSESPGSGVVDLDHETHSVRNLFIVDASSLPGPTAVNPQITIMAIALRASERIAARL